MVRRVALLILFLLAAPLVGQLRQSSLEVTPGPAGELLLTVKSSQPVRQVVEYLNREYGWLISYEDPVYPETELVDVAVPRWKKTHPGERGYLTPVFSEVTLHITKPLEHRSSQKRILEELVEQFNRLNRQEKFTVADQPGQRHVVIGSVSGRDGMQNATSSPKAAQRLGSEALSSLLEECSLRTQLPWTAGTILMKRNLSLQVLDTRVACRDALLNLATEGGPNLVYEILEDPNNKTFVVNIVPARVVVDTRSPK